VTAAEMDGRSPKYLRNQEFQGMRAGIDSTHLSHNRISISNTSVSYQVILRPMLKTEVNLNGKWKICST
jgi:hypothetical protein